MHWNGHRVNSAGSTHRPSCDEVSGVAEAAARLEMAKGPPHTVYAEARVHDAGVGGAVTTTAELGVRDVATDSGVSAFSTTTHARPEAV